MRVLVTGGTGYFGRALVCALNERGHEVVLFARSASTSGLPGIAIDGDVRNIAALRGAAHRCEVLVHAAALVSLWQRDPAVFDAINVDGFDHAVEAAAAAGVSRIVYTSTFLALPPSGSSVPLRANDYQRTKVAALERARRFQRDGMPLVTLIPGVLYGPGPLREGNLVGRLMRDHLDQRLPGLIGGSRRWPFTFVEDVVRAHLTAVEGSRVAGEYSLGGANLPQRTPFEWLHAREGHPLPRDLPMPLAWVAGAFVECRARLTDRSPAVTRAAVRIFRHDWDLDSRQAINDLGYLITPFESALAATYDDLTRHRPEQRGTR